MKEETDQPIEEPTEIMHIKQEIKEQGTEQGTLGTPCRDRVFKGKGLVNSNSEGTISEIGVNKVNHWGWNFIGYKLESESINPNTVLLAVPKIPEGSELANMVANDAKMVAKVTKLTANLVAKNDANLALPPRFRQFLIELPL
ncbi:hypothetical protein TNCV_1200751 [Trichonephila clavipes]|nr:hypothetical protein TNCV_1200751 [Trichonephila clavipes]